MLAQKKAAMASKNSLPARPGSAMSSFSPVRSVSTASGADVHPKKTRPESVIGNHGGLSVAPMRPTKMRPRPEIARPATAGPYSVRRPAHAATNSDSNTSPTTTRTQRTRAPSAATTSPPKRGSVPRPATSHSSHPTNSAPSSPAKVSGSRIAASPRAASPKIGSPRASPVRPKASALLLGSSPSKGDEDFTMVVPTLTGLKESYTAPNEPEESEDATEVAPEFTLGAPFEEPETAVTSPSRALKVYEDPFSGTDDPATPKPTFSAPVLEEVAANEDPAKIVRAEPVGETRKIVEMTPEKYKQNSRLLDSGISKIKAKSLDVHGFRKLQSMIRDNKATWTDEKFDALLSGLFEYLESPLTSLTPEKLQDVKAQILGTIKLMYKKDRGSFRPHVPAGLESLLVTRSCYDARAHIVSGLELLADDLITLAEPKATITAISTRLQKEDMTVEGCRILSMGLHVLKSLIESNKTFVPDDEEMAELCKLASRCLECSESGVRMDAVQLCVALHAQVGETPFWTKLEGVKDDPKSLITYYIVKRQREVAASA